MSSDSVVVFVVRKGNPKHITGWDDLIKPGIDVITPNPSTSGSARWNILAGYGAQLKEGKTPAQALAYVKTLLTKNVSVQDSSASAALQTFTQRQGRRAARLRVRRDRGPEGRRLDPVHHPQADDPDRDADRRHRQEQAPDPGQGVPDYQWSPAGQTIWAQQGYRPVMPSVAKQFTSEFPTPPQLFTIDYLGGWSKVKDQFFDPTTGRSPRSSRPRGCPLPPDAYAVAGRARPCPAADASARGAAARSAWDSRSLYMSVIVLIPLAAVTVKAVSQSPASSGSRSRNKTALTALA